MNKPLFIIGLALIVTLGALMFHIKYQVRYLKRDLEETHQLIQAEQEKIQVLRAEWAYLTRPERVSWLAKKYLHLSAPNDMQVADVRMLKTRHDQAVALANITVGSSSAANKALPVSLSVISPAPVRKPIIPAADYR